MTRKNLTFARGRRNDEFYTGLEDIEREMSHHPDLFRGKKVYCNCDRPTKSKFAEYFAVNFNSLGLERLTVTCMERKPQADLFGNGCEGEWEAEKLVVNGIDGWDGDMETIGRVGGNSVSPLDGDGDFRSRECVEILGQSDIVVTNPPFSLFREFASLVIGEGKQFLCIANQNTVFCKALFPLLKDGSVQVIHGFRNGVAEFSSPYMNYSTAAGTELPMSGLVWVTNTGERRWKPLSELKTEKPEGGYSRYDNFDAINVDRMRHFPKDHDGAIGTPITFMEYYDPDEYELLGFRTGDDGKDLSVNGRRTYMRMLVRKRERGKGGGRN